MDNFKKFFFIQLVFFFCLNVFSGETLYRKKPDWWDKVNVKVIPGKNFNETYNKTFENLDYQGEKIETWAVLGPLENNKNKPFEKIYGPEKTFKYDKKEIFGGIKGAKEKWQGWRKGEKCPIPANATNCVIFFYSVYKSPQEGKHYIVFTSDDGAEIWINRKKVFEFHDGRRMNFVDSDIIEVDLKKGKNDIWVKLAQGSSSWGLSMIMTQFAPKLIKLKTLIELYNKAPQISSKDRTYLGDIIEDEFLQLDDFPNYIYWFDNSLTEKTKSKINDLAYKIKEKEDLYPYVISYYKDIFGNPKIDKTTRMYCADFIIRESRERDDFDTLQNFLNIYSSALKTMMPYDYLSIMISMHIRKGEFEEATKLAEELKKQCDASGNKNITKKFNELFSIINNIKGTAIQLPMDWDFKTIEAETSKYLQDQKPAVNRFIRQTLSSKGSQVAPGKEKNLFIGQLPIYKQMFAPFDKEYSKDLDTYLTILKGTNTLDETNFLQRKALLSMEKTNFPVYKSWQKLSSINSIQLPSDKTKPFPFLYMHQGTTEMLAENNPITSRLEKQPPAFICSNDNIKVFQNYHELVCLENNKIKWKYVSTSSTPKTYSKAEDKCYIIFGKTFPVINDGKVFARLMKDGVMNLFCFDAASGKINWIFNSNGTEICSGISLWRDKVIFLGREPDTITRYYIFEINQQNGEVTGKTFVCGAETTFIIGKQTRRLQADLFLPEPLIMDDQAYISTNNGVVIAFDLSTDSLKWIKKYNKPSYRDDKTVRTLAHRSSPAPIAGKDNILFSPLNSAYFLLLNKETGEDAERLTINWREVIPCGEQVIIIDNKGGAAFYSLKNLKSQNTLPGKNYRLVQRFDDGVALQTDNKLVIYDLKGKLKKSMAVPESTNIIFVDKDSLLAYNSQTKTRPTIEKFLQKQPATILNSAPEATIPQVSDAKFKKVENAWYMISKGAVMRINPDASIKWAFPLMGSNGLKIYPSGNYLYIFTYNRIFCLQKENGALKNFFPDYGERLQEIQSEMVFPQGAAFLNGYNWDADVFRFTPEKTERLGHYRGDAPIAAFEFGALIAAWKSYGSRLRFLRNDPQKKEYQTETAAYNLKKSFRPSIRKVLNDKTVMLTDLSSMLFVTADKKASEIQMVKGSKKMPTWGSNHHFSIEGNYCLFRNYYDIVNLVDLKKKKDLGSIPNFSSMPVYVDGRFIGFSKNEIVCFDPESGKIVYKIQDWSKEKNNKKLDEMKKNLLTFKLGNKAAFLFQVSPNYNFSRASEEGCMILISPDKPEIETVFFQGGESASVFTDTGDGLIVSLPEEEKVIRLSKKDIDVLTKQSPNLFSSENTPIEYTIDGYPDEWDLSKFHKINKNRFDARILDQKYLLLAIELNDSAIIDQLGKKGFDDEVKIMISPGQVAGLRSSSCMKTGKDYLVSFYGKLQSSKERDSMISYSVKPDGSSCFIELKVPLNKIIYQYLTYHLRSESRKRRGDIAFDLIYTDDMANKRGLLSQSEIPAFFPRIFFPDWQEKKKKK